MAQRFLADLHIHSHHSVATSKDLDPEHLDLWARIKGLTVIGTGDFTHPGWLEELRSKLEPAEHGLFRLRQELEIHDGLAAGSAVRPVRFLLSAEVSTIYKKAGKGRKVHHLILAPDFGTATKIQQVLARIGNINSDGRPILGLDSRDLLEIALEASEDIVFIPAHIWTPWFSALGDKGGFDSIEDCYADLADHIHAIETGLSSDPAMNWRCSRLDRYNIVSNSDAHNPENLGREANIFNCDLSYQAISEAIATGHGLEGTIEFFPQEGKYHYDGHRRCGICWHPRQTLANNGICPVCNRPVTIGVMHRVVQLADRPDGIRPQGRPPYWSIIPLKEILGQIMQTGPGSKKVSEAYHYLVGRCGSELGILLDEEIESIRSIAGPALAKAIEDMRKGRIQIQEGFDGQYGTITVFGEQQRLELARQGLLFSEPIYKAPLSQQIQDPYTDKQTSQPLLVRQPLPTERPAGPQDPMRGLDRRQLEAASHMQGPALVIAGPGTGKTRVLTCRIARLITAHAIPPQQILAVTFTRKAAEQMRDRLSTMIPQELVDEVTICTFHRLGLRILKEQRSETRFVIDKADKEQILARIGCKHDLVASVAERIAKAKQQLVLPDDLADQELADIYRRYQRLLESKGLLDLEDLLLQPAIILKNDAEISRHYRQIFQWVLVDEYQDVNYAQYMLLRLLCPDDQANIYAIGDPNQAIYGFRGADVRFIRQFTEDYPSAKIYQLATSYRCSDPILKASCQVLGSRSVLQGLPSQIKIQLVQHPTENAEAEFVARTIERMIGGLRFFSIDSQISNGDGATDTQTLTDFAILCRTFAQMPVIEKALQDHCIPYQVVGGEPFFETGPTRVVLDRLRLAVWPDHPWLIERLKDNPTVLSIDQISPAEPAWEAISRIVEAAFGSADQQAQLKELVDWARQLNQSVEDLVRHIQLAQPQDLYDHKAQKVTLMTLHASKGLEFGCVFIVGCEDGIIPYRPFEGMQTDIDEEGRLLYVGMTRARQWLYLTWAQSRVLYGKTLNLPRSPFLAAIQEALTEQRIATLPTRSRTHSRQLSLFD